MHFRSSLSEKQAEILVKFQRTGWSSGGSCARVIFSMTAPRRSD
jgi:hypothetical protein